MPVFAKKHNEKEVCKNVGSIIVQLDEIYANKSGDEYKIHGDITKSPVYDRMQRMLADLTLLHGFPKTEADDLKKMFNILHRPSFKNAVTKYIAEHSPENAMMTAYFTIGYRTILGELSRIYTSTEATEDGFKYTPTKISRKNDKRKFIRVFNLKSDAELTNTIRKTTKAVLTQESAVFMQEAFVGSAAAVAGALGVLADKLTPFLREIGAWFELLFGNVSELNPITFVSYMLSDRYDTNVRRFEEAAALYEATKSAYDEYMKIPEAQRNKKIESRYVQNIDKYNIKMRNLYAKIEHYDQRALKEAIDKESKVSTTTDTKDTSSSSKSTETTNDKSTTDLDDDPDF